MDAFFASVEVVRDPSLKGKPLIVGGDRDARGVVCTASYEARKFGVHSAMPLTEARRLCPHAVFMKGNFAHYQEASEQVRAVLETPVDHEIEPLLAGYDADKARRLRALDLDAEAIAARGRRYEHLDQLLMEYLLGVRG